MYFTWNTQDQVDEPMAQVTELSTAKTWKLSATTTKMDMDHCTQYVYRALADGLKPNQTYEYAVGATQEPWSPPAQFQTRGFSGDLPVIAIIGDMGLVNDHSLAPLTAYLSKNEFDLIIHAGDLAVSTFAALNFCSTIAQV